jgi:hypothetical protein
LEFLALACHRLSIGVRSGRELLELLTFVVELSPQGIQLPGARVKSRLRLLELRSGGSKGLD